MFIIHVRADVLGVERHARTTAPKGWLLSFGRRIFQFRTELTVQRTRAHNARRVLSHVVCAFLCISGGFKYLVHAPTGGGQAPLSE